MIYEWYSGSDESDEIPKALALMDRDFTDLDAEERLRRLQPLLSNERDPNWRGYLRFRIALELKELKRKEEARIALQEAIREFDPFAGNIRDVMPQYTGALHSLILEHLWVDKNAEEIVEYATIIVANLNESLLPPAGVSLTFGYLARALSRIGHDRNLPFLYRLALNFAIRAHHAEPEDPLFLEQLVYCHFNVREAQRCRMAYEMFLRVDPPQALKQRVGEFMQDRFHEIGGSLEAPN